MIQTIFQLKGQIRLFKVNGFSETQHRKKRRKSCETITPRERTPQAGIDIYPPSTSMLKVCICWRLNAIYLTVLSFFISDKSFFEFHFKCCTNTFTVFFFFLIYWNFVGTEGKKLQTTQTPESQSRFQPYYLLSCFRGPTSLPKRFDRTVMISRRCFYSTLLSHVQFTRPDTCTVKLSS